jgi:hypothetical protein
MICLHSNFNYVGPVILAEVLTTIHMTLEDEFHLSYATSVLRIVRSSYLLVLSIRAVSFIGHSYLLAHSRAEICFTTLGCIA